MNFSPMNPTRPVCLSNMINEDDTHEINNVTPSCYLDAENFGELTKTIKHGNCLSIMNTNARSLVKNKANYDLLFECIRSEYNFQFDILTFDETWLNSELEQLVTFENYRQVMKHKLPKKEGGGLAFFVKNNIEFIHRNDILLPTELQSKFECLFIEVPTQNEHIVIGLMYRSPSHDSIAEVNHFLRTTIEQLNLEKKTIILLGDVNINLLKANSNPNISYYLDLMLSYNLLHCTCNYPPHTYHSINSNIN